MNGEFTLEIAATIADRARKAAPDSRPDQVRSIWSWIYGTTPQDAELHAAVAFLEAQEASFRQIDPPPKEDAAPSDSPAQRDALASFAHALLSSNRFLYVD